MSISEVSGEATPSVEELTPLKNFPDFLRKRLGAELGDKLVALPGTSTGISRWDIHIGDVPLGVLWAYGKPGYHTTIEYQGRIDLPTKENPNPKKFRLVYTPDFKNGETVSDSWTRRDKQDIPFP